MKSGDVKNVARRDVIVSKADIIELWRTSKRDNRLDHAFVEKEVQAELGYDAKLSSFRESISEKNIRIEQLRATFKLQRESIAQRLYEHLEKTYKGAEPYMLGTYFVLYTNRLMGLDEEGFGAVEKAYDEVKGKVNPGSDAEEFVAKSYAEFREIKNSYTSALAASGISKARQELDELLKEQKGFVQYCKTKMGEMEQSNFHKAITEFLLKFKETHALSFKTDLNGEATVAIPGGRCYLFCDAEIGLSHMTWNYPVDIVREGQYVELSNDNAASVEESEAVQVMEILTGAEMGLVS
jgi:hypothetical protein